MAEYAPPSMFFEHDSVASEAYGFFLITDNSFRFSAGVLLGQNGLFPHRSSGGTPLIFLL